jgi:RNA polymerase sigma-70 factor (ECF subfamily)
LNDQQASSEAHDISDHELVRRCQDGDKRAMETLMRQYQQWVYNIAYGMLASPEDASDVAQDVFLWLWENIGQFRFKSQFSTWLYRIVTNRCLNLKDQRQRRKTDPMEIDDSQPWVPLDTTTPESTVLQAEQREMLQQALASLKDDYRKILILREMQDLSYEELTEVLGCSLGRVRSRLHEARQALRKAIQRIE